MSPSLLCRQVSVEKALDPTPEIELRLLRSPTVPLFGISHPFQLAFVRLNSIAKL